MNQPGQKDRPIHFLVYLVAGAAMGGFLDVVVFKQPTPIYGMMFGAIVAVFYQIALWLARGVGRGTKN